MSMDLAAPRMARIHTRHHRIHVLFFTHDGWNPQVAHTSTPSPDTRTHEFGGEGRDTTSELGMDDPSYSKLTTVI